MRHLCQLFSFDFLEISLLSCRVACSTLLGALVTLPGGSDRFPPYSIGTRVIAVPVAVVTPVAQEEHLPAMGAGHDA